ncbi:MAG: hypothetical protein DRQ45_05480 [Gammaproteobacteria bacterium]|nr:MAG: hypothetical protein DRQ45_05480 [Gammaproteobacteria bacterium]
MCWLDPRLRGDDDKNNRACKALLRQSTCWCGDENVSIALAKRSYVNCCADKKYLFPLPGPLPEGEGMVGRETPAGLTLYIDSISTSQNSMVFTTLGIWH